MMKVALFSVSVIVCLAIAHGLKCYTCSSGDSAVTEGHCGDKFNTTLNAVNLKECKTGEMYCKKRKTGVNHVYTKVTRECAVECEEKNTVYVDRTTCCKTDKCNGASAVTLPVTLLFTCSLYAVYSFLKQ